MITSVIHEISWEASHNRAAVSAGIAGNAETNKRDITSGRGPGRGAPGPYNSYFPFVTPTYITRGMLRVITYVIKLVHTGTNQ